MTQPLTEQQLDDIETRAAHLTEYATLTDKPLQADADQLTGTDVPALLAEVRRLRARVAELESGIAWRDEERRRWVDVHSLVERAIDKGWSAVDTLDLEAELTPAAAVSSAAETPGSAR